MAIVDQIVKVKTDLTDKPYELISLNVNIVHMSAAELKQHGIDPSTK